MHQLSLIINGIPELRDPHCRECTWYLDLQLPMQSVPITTKFVSSNTAVAEVYSIQHYVIKFVSDLRLLGSFLRVLRFPQL